MDPDCDAWRRSIIDWLPQFLWTSDAEGRLTYVDPRFNELLGITRDEGEAPGWFVRIGLVLAGSYFLALGIISLSWEVYKLRA